MLRREYIRRKLYASSLNTPRGRIKGLKGESELQGRYLDIKRQEGNYEQRIFILKCNQQCSIDVFSDGK